MKLTNISGLVAVTALALMAFVGTASATTLETAGVAENSAITIKASLKAGTSELLTDTFGFAVNTCTGATIEGKTSVFTGASVSGPISSMSFIPCTEGTIVVDAAGSLSITNIAGTTNGTVRWIAATITVPSPFGLLRCTTATGEGTDIGTLTGVKKSTEHATIDINAVLGCTGVGSARWTGTYTVTSPTGLGVGA